MDKVGKKYRGADRPSAAGESAPRAQAPDGEQGSGKTLLSPSDRRQLARSTSRNLARADFPVLPNLIVNAGEHATRTFLEFFVATIRNKNTRMAYARAVSGFLAWCEDRGLTLERIQPLAVAAYIE